MSEGRQMVGIDIENIRRLVVLCEYGLSVPNPSENRELVNNITNYIAGLFVRSIDDNIKFTRTNKTWVLECLRDNKLQELVDEWSIVLD